jgi:hypothetical protein
MWIHRRCFERAEGLGSRVEEKPVDAIEAKAMI